MYCWFSFGVGLLFGLFTYLFWMHPSRKLYYETVIQWFKLYSKQAYDLGLEPNFPKIVNLDRVWVQQDQ